jgi:hypothetical protein
VQKVLKRKDELRSYIERHYKTPSARAYTVKKWLANDMENIVNGGVGDNPERSVEVSYVDALIEAELIEEYEKAEAQGATKTVDRA